MTQRYKLTIEYNGYGTVGWQRQQEGLSIQGALEEAVFCLTRQKLEVVGAGRTHAGVHATGQVAHVDLDKEWDLYKLLHGLNHHLRENINIEPCPISVVEVEPVSQEFHARFSAKRRFYQYVMLNRNARPALMAGKVWFVPEQLDLEAMQEAANHLIGTHDFSSFRDSLCQAKSPIKTLDSIEIIQAGQTVVTNLHALSFLHRQVRIIMGNLWQVGTGRIPVDQIKVILEAKDRTQSGPTAPSDGLYLTHVEY